jgi:hypothetical protein
MYISHYAGVTIMTVQQQTHSHPLRGLDLFASRVLIYKFFVRDRSLVPQGLREGARQSNRTVDRQHAEVARAAGQANVAEVDRIRPNRVDTGMPVYQHEQRVHIGSVRSLLAHKGFWLADAYFFEKPAQRDKPADFVIVLVLSMDNEEAMRIPRATMEGLRRLARENIWTAHVWDNSNLGNPSTVNFTSRQQGNPKHTLVVRADFLQLVTSDGENAAVVEDREDQRVAQDLLNDLEGL